MWWIDAAGFEVRLGLVIGEIGEKNSLQVSQDELRRALVEQRVAKIDMCRSVVRLCQQRFHG